MSDKIYCGRGKTFGQYGTISVSICLDDIPDQHITKSDKNGKRYVKVNVDAKREADEYGNTHTVTVDTWKPTGRSAQAPKSAPAPRPAMEDDESGDLPF
jgi:hypothetical protein